MRLGPPLWGVFLLSELTGFNSADQNLLAMKRACTEPPSVKTSSDSLLLTWTWRNSLSILGERGCVGPSMPWTEVLLCSAFCWTCLPLPENEDFCPLVWRQPSYGKKWIVCSAASPKQCSTNRCVNFSIQCNEVLVAKQEFWQFKLPHVHQAVKEV